MRIRNLGELIYSSKHYPPEYENTEAYFELRLDNPEPRLLQACEAVVGPHPEGWAWSHEGLAEGHELLIHDLEPDSDDEISFNHQALHLNEGLFNATYPRLQNFASEIKRVWGIDEDSEPQTPYHSPFFNMGSDEGSVEPSLSMMCYIPIILLKAIALATKQYRINPTVKQRNNFTLIYTSPRQVENSDRLLEAVAQDLERSMRRAIKPDTFLADVCSHVPILQPAR